MEMTNAAAVGLQFKKRIQSHRKLIETFSFLVAANILAAAIGWVTQVHIANAFGRELFGKVAYAYVIGAFGQVIIRAGLDRTLVRDLIHFPERFAELVRASLYLRYALTAFLAGCFLIWKLLSKDPSLEWGVVLIAMSSSMLSLDLQPVYDVWHRIQRHTIYFLIQKTVYLLLIWAAILALGNLFSLFWIGVAITASVFLYLVLQHRWVLKRMERAPRMGLREAAGSVIWLLRQNWLIWLTAILGLVTVALNQLALKQYFGYAELGVYAAAWQLVMIGTLFTEQVARMGRPAMARIVRPEAGRREQLRFVLGYSAVMSAVVLPMVALMVIFPEAVLGLIFRPEYIGAAAILPFLGGYLFLSSAGMVVSQYMLSARLDRAYFLSVTAGGVLSIALCPALITSHGITGAAYALLAAHGLAILAYCLSAAMYLSRCPRIGQVQD